jgi:hypothetical protein
LARSDLDSSPSAAYLRSLFDFQEKDKGILAQKRLDKRILDLYFGEHMIEAEDTNDPNRKRRVQVERLSIGEAQRVNDLITSFYTNWPEIGTQWTGAGTFNENRSETVARGMNEMLDQLNPAMDSPWYRGVWQMDLLGRTPDFIVNTNQYYHDFPYKQSGQSEEQAKKAQDDWKKSSPLPILWEVLPAESTFPASLATVNDEVLSIKTVTWTELADMFSDKELADAWPQEEGARRGEVKLAIYSNRQFLVYAVLADNKSGLRVGGFGGKYNDHVLREVEHKIGRSVIQIVPGMITGRKELPYYWRSVLYPVLSLIEGADKIATALRTGAKFKVAPLLKVWMHTAETEGTDGASAKITQYLANDLLILDPGDGQTRGREDAAAVFQPDELQSLERIFTMIVERIGRMTGAVEVLEGQVSPTAPAWSQNFASEMAKGKLRPLTSAHVARVIHSAEMISAAAIAHGGNIPLAKLDEASTRTGSIELNIADLAQYKPVFTGTYEAKVPANWRADADQGAKLFQMALADPPQIILDPAWILERFFGETGDLWTRHYRGMLDMRFMMQTRIMEFQTQDIAERFEAAMEEQNGITEGQFNQKAGGLSPKTADILRGFIGQKRPGLSPATVGANRASTPFSAAAPEATVNQVTPP